MQSSVSTCGWLVRGVRLLCAAGAATLVLSSTVIAADDAASPPVPAGETTTTSDQSDASAKLVLVYLEMTIIGQAFPNDSVEKRLVRIEQIVFGKEQDGKADQRLANLLSKVTIGSADKPRHPLKAGISASDLDEERPGFDHMNENGTGRGGRATHRSNGALRLAFSIGGSHVQHSFNGQSQIDEFVSQYVKYIAAVLKNEPPARRMHIDLTMLDPGISGGFGDGHIRAHRAAVAIAAPGAAELRSASGSEAYGKIATAGFVSFLPPRAVNEHAHASSADDSPVHFSPLIIEMRLGGSGIENSFNGGKPQLLSEVQSGKLPVVPSARPYALSVSMGLSHMVHSFDSPTPEGNVEIAALAASSDFQQSSTSSAKGERPLVVSINAGGSGIKNCFNNTGGIVRLANEIADGLESSLRPDQLNSLTEIYLSKGGCGIVDSYSTK